MLLGRNPASPYLLAYLGITEETKEQWNLGRLRDVYTNDEGTKIFVFTRNGPSGVGLTQEQRDEIDRNFRESHEHYVGFEIDDFDQTYLTYEFNTPPEFLEQTKEIADVTETEPPMARFRRLIDDMQSGKDNEAVRNAMEAGEKLLKPVVEGQNADVEHGDGSMVIRQISPE